MCAICCGAEILTPAYLKAVAKGGGFAVDPARFRVTDQACEAACAHRWNLREYTLAAAFERRVANGPLLKRYKVHCLPSAFASRADMALIVASAGGTFLEDAPADLDDPWLLLLGERAAIDEQELLTRRLHRVYAVEMMRQAAITQMIPRERHRI